MYLKKQKPSAFLEMGAGKGKHYAFYLAPVFFILFTNSKLQN